MKRDDFVKPPIAKSKSKKSIDGWAIGIQMMDTAWRVAVPIIVLTILGIKLDKSNGTQPLYTLVGLFLALATSSLLIYRQIQHLYPDFFKRNGKKPKS